MKRAQWFKCNCWPCVKYERTERPYLRTRIKPSARPHTPTRVQARLAETEAHEHGVAEEAVALADALGGAGAVAAKTNCGGRL